MSVKFGEVVVMPGSTDAAESSNNNNNTSTSTSINSNGTVERDANAELEEITDTLKGIIPLINKN